MAGTLFNLHADQVGGTIAVEGIDIPPEQILGWEILGGPQTPTRLLLHIATEGVVTGSGIVETIRDAATGDAVRRLDPAKIKAEALARGGMGTDTTAKVVEVIAEMLDQAGPT